jgi:HAD superfamily hydrolase (TIGR01509 family)
MVPRAVFFDFDGVIADTENIHVAAWQRTLGALGWDVPDEVCARAVEIDDRAFLAELFATRKVEGGDLEGWVRRKQELTRTLLADSPRIYPGVADLIEKLRGRVRLAVVSTTWRENVTSVLGALHLADAFETIVGKEDVSNVKPDPECYRHALARLAVHPAEAVAIEDSASGLASAHAAALRTLAVGHRFSQGDWSSNSAYVDDLTRTDAVLEALGFRATAD